jgi:hypothetical protein
VLSLFVDPFHLFLDLFLFFKGFLQFQFFIPFISMFTAYPVTRGFVMKNFFGLICDINTLVSSLVQLKMCLIFFYAVYAVSDEISFSSPSYANMVIPFVLAIPRLCETVSFSF